MTVTTLRRLTTMTYGGALASDERAPGNVPVMSSGGITGAHDRANTLAPVIVVGRKGSHGSVWWSDYPAFVIDTAYSIDKSNSDMELRWLYYLLQTIGLNRLSNDVGVPGLSREAAYEARVRLVGRDEQRRIADFLDDHVARIDQIITARRQQLLLDRQRFRSELQRRIWPSTDTAPLKYLLAGVTSGPRGWGDLVRDQGTPFVRIGNLRPLGIELITSNLARVDMPTDAEAQRASLVDGDVLLSITAAFGEVAVWRGGEGTFSQHVARLRPRVDTDSEWIAWALQTQGAHDQYKLLAYGGTKIGMGLDHVRNLMLPAVDGPSRAQSAEGVNRAWSSHDRAQNALRRSVDLLSEYKQSLITAAVTGELDVTTAGTGVPG